MLWTVFESAQYRGKFSAALATLHRWEDNIKIDFQ